MLVNRDMIKSGDWGATFFKKASFLLSDDAITSLATAEVDFAGGNKNIEAAVVSKGAILAYHTNV